MSQAQPYRATGKRREGPALAAMTRGEAPYMRHVARMRRHAMKRKRRRKGRPRDRSPLHKILAERRSYNR